MTTGGSGGAPLTAEPPRPGAGPGPWTRRARRFPRWLAGALRRLPRTLVERIRTWWREWPGPFGKVPVDTRDPSGLLSPRGRWEFWAVLGGIAFGLWVGLFMVLIYMQQAPVPPGGDPGEWIAGSYQFIGQPFPSWYASSDSPPLLFPILGALVIVGGGPIQASHLFVILEATLLGGSTYVLARSVTRHPVTALGIEGFVILNPTLDALFFSGAYQYLFAFVFMNLTIAYAVRLVRSRRDLHLALFWGCGTAALLAHPSMIAELPGILTLMGFMLLWMRQLPKELVTRWSGRIGAAVFGGVAVTWYLLVPRLLGLHQNNFLLKNGYFFVIQDTIGIVFGTVVDPFFPKWAVDPTQTIQLFEVILGLGGVGLVLLRLLKPRWLTLPWLTVISWGVAQIVFAYVGYKLQIVTPYSRFGELLVLPVLLAVGMAIEGSVFWASTIVESPDPPPPAKPWRHRVLWRRIRTSPRWTLIIPAVLAAVLLAGLGVYVNQDTTPNFQRLEGSYTKIAHNASFLDMLAFLNNASISGSILTIAHATSWTRAITHRDVYAPFLPGYALNEPHILIDEEVGFSLNYRYAVTNDLVACTASGYSTAYINALPMYEASYFGLFFPVLRVIPQTLVVNESGHLVPIFTRNSPPPLYLLPPAGGGANGSTLGMVLAGRGANVTILASPIPNTASSTITVYANATGAVNLTGLTATIAPSVGLSAWFNETGGGAFTWNPHQIFGSYGYTTGVVSPASALQPLPVGRNASLPSKQGMNLSVAPPPGANGSAPVPVRSLSFTLTLTSPSSTNFITQLPTFISAGAVWDSLDAGLFLYERQAVPRIVAQAVNPAELSWLQSEFGMTLLWTNNDWQVYLLPTLPVGPP